MRRGKKENVERNSSPRCDSSVYDRSGYPEADAVRTTTPADPDLVEQGKDFMQDMEILQQFALGNNFTRGKSH